MEPEILKSGDDSGNKMVVKYTSDDGVVVHAIGVPQAWETPLGPTWSYVVESDHLTLVDTGCNGTVQHLEEGLEVVGYPLSAVERIVVTHGHLDHDGNCLDVIKRSGAELWAHEVYSELLGVNRWEREMEWRQQDHGFPEAEDEEFIGRILDHHRLSAQLSVNNIIRDGQVADGLTFYYTPGHSPDELCIQFEKVLFSGDHILPLITPHPSVSLSYKRFQDILPEEYRTENKYYGLKAFFKSLKKVECLGDDITVLPAHRAVHRGKFNPIGLERVGELLEHHRDRCYRLLELVKDDPLDMTAITRKLFESQRLDEVNFYLAYSEVMSHIEFLQECGDVEMVGEGARLVNSHGTDKFSAAMDAL